MKKKVELLKDYFSFKWIEEEEDEEKGGLIQVDITEKGQKFLQKRKQEDPNFEEDKYLTDLIVKALTSYLDKAEKIQSGEIDEDNKG